MNFTTIIGRLGKAPESFGEGDKGGCKFSVATNRRNKAKTTDWHRVVAFGKLAEICTQYLDKGSRVAIVGELQYGSYEKDGQTVYTADIVAREMEMLGEKGESKEDDLPF